MHTLLHCERRAKVNEHAPAPIPAPLGEGTPINRGAEILMAKIRFELSAYIDIVPGILYILLEARCLHGFRSY